MPKNNRIKTTYPGVYYIEGSPRITGRGERIYYVRYRKNGRLVEKKAGGQFRDNMTPAKAARIRAEYMANKRLSNEKIRSGNINENIKAPMKVNGRFGKDISDPALLQEKWLLFMEASTESFILYDSKLNVIEINQATLELYPPGTKKNDIVGKNLLEIIPELKNRYEIGKYKEVIETGEPFYAEGDPAPKIFGDKHLNYKAFKVGDGMGMIIRDVTDSKRKEEELKKKKADLEIETLNLEEANTALKVLLKKREEDKKDLEQKVLANVKELIEPYVKKIKESSLDERQKAYIGLIEANLDDITAPFIREVSNKYIGLTHAEIEVANLIKHGKATKEIAELLCLSSYTIQSYRKSIRKKLAINNKKVNLRTYLSSFN